MHLHWDTLFDAFEGTILASYHLSDPPHTMATESCWVSDGKTHTADCGAYEAYVKDHLEN